MKLYILHKSYPPDFFLKLRCKNHISMGMGVLGCGKIQLIFFGTILKNVKKREVGMGLLERPRGSNFGTDF